MNPTPTIFMPYHALDDLILRGPRGSQPAASATTPGALYCVTNEGAIVERSNGAAWEAYSPAAAGAGFVRGPASAVTNNLASYADATGLLIRDSGLPTALVARKDVDNLFTASQTLPSFSSITGPFSTLWLKDTAAAVDARTWRFVAYNDGVLRVEALNDAASVVQATPLMLGRGGNVFVAGSLVASGVATGSYGGLHHAATWGECRLVETAAPANAQMVRLMAYQQEFQVWLALDTAVAAATYHFSRTALTVPGAITASGAITAPNLPQLNTANTWTAVNTFNAQTNLSGPSFTNALQSTTMHAVTSLSTAGTLVVSGATTLAGVTCGDLYAGYINSCLALEARAHVRATTFLQAGTTLSVGTDAFIGGSVKATQWIYERGRTNPMCYPVAIPATSYIGATGLPFSGSLAYARAGSMIHLAGSISGTVTAGTPNQANYFLYLPESLTAFSDGAVPIVVYDSTGWATGSAHFAINSNVVNLYASNLRPWVASQLVFILFSMWIPVNPTN